MKWAIAIECECSKGEDASNAMREVATMVNHDIGPEPMREASGVGYRGFHTRRETYRWAITRAEAENDSPPLPESQPKGNE